MKREIEPSEIRKGDVVRFEERASDAVSMIAIEYRAVRDGHAYLPKGLGQHYLLDRPEPAVELPTEPTLGWLGFHDGDESGHVLGQWYRLNSHVAHAHSAGSYSHGYVTAFVPATAVPTAALKALQDAWPWDAPAPVDAFLAAVDEVQS